MKSKRRCKRAVVAFWSTIEWMPRELVSVAVLNSAYAWRCSRRTTKRTNLLLPYNRQRNGAVIIHVCRRPSGNDKIDLSVVPILLKSLDVIRIRFIIFFSCFFCSLSLSLSPYVFHFFLFIYSIVSSLFCCKNLHRFKKFNVAFLKIYINVLSQIIHD